MPAQDQLTAAAARPPMFPTFDAEAQSQQAVSAPADSGVGGDAAQPMTDEERERAIQAEGELMQARYAVWASDGCFAALGEAHAALARQTALIKGRSAAQVARMEAQRGLA